MTDNLQDKAEKAVLSMASVARHAPHYFILLLIVGSFLWFLDRKNQAIHKQNDKEDLVSRLRIEQCHAVQDESVKVMGELREVMREQSETFGALTMLINDHLDSAGFEKLEEDK